MPLARAPRHRLVAVLLLAAAVVAPAAPQAQGEQITLGVEGRANAAPWIAAAGRVVAVAWGATAPGGKAADVYVAVSQDGGERFATPVRVNAAEGEARLGGEIPPRVALVAHDGRAPDVVVLWNARGARTTVKLARSTDGGHTFGAAQDLVGSAAGDRGWTALAVDGRGEAHAVWLDHRGLAAATADSVQHTAAGHAAGTATHDGVAMAQKSGLYYARGGAAAPPARQLTPGVCYCCKTALAVTPRGGLVLAWRHVFAGNLRDIAFTTSADGGGRFAAPQPLSRDGWTIDACPDDGPALSVDAAGTAHAVWPTVIGGGTDAAEGAIFYAALREGATAFSPRQRVPTLGSPKPSHPQVLARADGSLLVGWDEVRDGRRAAVVRPARAATDGTLAVGAPIVLGAGGATTYPVLAESDGVAVVAFTEAQGGTSRIGVRRLAGGTGSR